MDSFKTLVTTISSIRPHPDMATTSLEIATVFDWNVVIRKGQFNVGDKVIYVCVDSVLSPETEAKVFGENSKVKLTNGRVKQIRLRKYPSQGLLVSMDLLPPELKDCAVGTNVCEALGISKYEPPAPSWQRASSPILRNRPLENPRLHTYKGVENLKWHPEVLDNKEVVVQTKIHGTSARMGLHPTVANTTWKKLKQLVGLLPKWEICWGSNNVELTNRSGHKGFYGDDVYSKAFKNCNAELKLEKGETIYGEVVFEGCQKDYHYGHKEPHFILFDVKVTREDGRSEFLNPEEAESYAKLRGFDFVPVIYRGLFDKAKIESLLSGPCDYHAPHVKEGVVIKLRTGYHGGPNGKHAYKWINPEYLDKNNSDNH